MRSLTVVLLAGGAMALAGIGPAAEDTTRAGTHRLESQWRPDFQAARHYANDRSGEVRFMIIDPFGRADRLRQSASAPMASLFKALLLATYLSQGDVRDRSLRDWEKDLLGPMIKRSDNESATRVRDMLGAGRIKRMARKAHMQDFSYHPVWGLSRSSPRDQASFFLKLERYLPERHEGYAKYLLAHIVKSQRWGVGKVRPKGWRLYFKGGWGSGSGSVNHQTALYERGGCRVALSVMTENNPSHGYGSESIEGVTRRLLHGFGGVSCQGHEIRRRAHARGLSFVREPAP